MTTNEQGSGIDSSNWDQSLGGFEAREAYEIVGNTDAHAHRERVAQSDAQAARRRAEYDRERASGIGVSPTLDNALGKRLTDGPLAGIKRNAAGAKKVEHRLDEEFEYLMGLEAGQRDSELLAAAWDAAQAKAKVPSILLAAQEFDRSTVPTTHPLAHRSQLLEQMRGHWAFANREAVLAERVELEQVLGEESTSILDESVRVYRTLVDATGEVDNAEAVITDGRHNVLDAFKKWPKLVERWRQVQCARQWLALVENNGFDEKHPESLIRTDAQMIEKDVWSSQFVDQTGVQVAHVDSPVAALQWYAEHTAKVDV
ncbi:hypothetical protein KZO37_13275 [Rhodococcus fascians]|uniref:hypothetical protein n=1 Tax=Nocardiaceae TaxID=85025 RepID=UPI0019D246BA|nr:MULTISPECIES: hypothetical protein [Rhodococcus]MBW4780337.1 hypothetical protein [Rhodococcus fascians]MDJ0005006.1 hypothetical protein [Rhodococcus fascians]